MGEPGQGVPDTHVTGGESPGNALPGETLCDHGITMNETQIVENKLMGSHPGENRNAKQNQGQAE